MSASPTQVYQIVNSKSVQVGDGTLGSSPMQVTLVGGGVISVNGTANEITASPTQGNVVLSIPTDFRPPGSLALGGAPTGAASFSSLYTNAAGSGNAANANIDIEQTAATTGTLTGLSVASNGNSAAGTVAGVQGIVGQVSNLNGNTVTTMKSVIGAFSVTGAGNVGDAECFYANPVARSGGGTGTITNAYAFYAGTYGAGITHKWGVYISDITANNFFAGFVGVSNNTPGGWSSGANFETRTTANGQIAVSGYAIGANGSAFLGRVDQTSTDYAQWFFNGGNQTGSITTDGTNTAYNTTSDARLKDVDIPQFDYREAIEKLWVGNFVWRDGGKPGFGVIAQQAYEHFPEAITKPADDARLWQADYAKLAPLALWGVKMLMAENNDLRRRLEILESRLQDAQL